MMSLYFKDLTLMITVSF